VTSAPARSASGIVGYETAGRHPPRGVPVGS